MKIPKQFKLFGHIITVEYDEEMTEKNDLVGIARYRENKIKLLPNKGLYSNRPKTDVEQTFLHEVIHFILNYMGEDSLSNNEKFVDTFSNLLYQFLITQEGELK